MKFDFFDLRLFINVAESSSLTKGAERVSISLPAASARMKNLEEAVGARLLKRTTHGVELTTAGHAMLSHARRVHQQLEHMACDLGEYADGGQARIRLMATTIAMAGSLPARIGVFVNANPHAVVDIAERRSTEIIAALREGRADIGLVNETAVVAGFEQHSFSRERLVLAVRKGHRFAQREIIHFEESLEERQIAMPVGSSVGSVLLEIATALGRERAFGTRVSSFESLCRLVELGIGIGVVPESSALRYRGYIDVAIVPLADPWANIVVKLVARDDVRLPRLARELFDRLLDEAES
jgi:DNA-binding transcriptional LysR family regulator